MPKYHVHTNEIYRFTYEVEADSPDAAIEVAAGLLDPDAYVIDKEWIDYWGDDGGPEAVEVP